MGEEDGAVATGEGWYPVDAGQTNDEPEISSWSPSTLGNHEAPHGGITNEDSSRARSSGSDAWIPILMTMELPSRDAARPAGSAAVTVRRRGRERM
jgi:hypothetical protein